MSKRKKSVTYLGTTWAATTWNLTALVLAYAGFVSVVLADVLRPW